MRKVDLFLKMERKVENEKNTVLTFPNSYLNLLQLSATFQRIRKVKNRPTFQLSSTIYSRESKKVESANRKMVSIHEHSWECLML